MEKESYVIQYWSCQDQMQYSHFIESLLRFYEFCFNNWLVILDSEQCKIVNTP